MPQRGHPSAKEWQGMWVDEEGVPIPSVGMEMGHKRADTHREEQEQASGESPAWGE